MTDTELATAEQPLTRGRWVIRRDGKHWCGLTPSCQTHKLVRVSVGPGEVVPNHIAWHYAMSDGCRIPSDKVWLAYGMFPGEEPACEWRCATRDEIAKQEADMAAGGFVFLLAKHDTENRTSLPPDNSVSTVSNVSVDKQ